MRKTLLVLLVVLIAAAATVLSAREKMSYIYKRGDTTYMRSDGDLSNLKAIQKRYGSEFVWVRDGGDTYVLTDPAVLASIRGIFSELDRLNAPMREIEERMKPHEREMEKIESRLDAVTEQLDDEDLSDSQRDSLESKMHGIEAEMRQVEKRMNEVERELDRMEREMDIQEEAAEKRFEDVVTRAIRAGKAQRAD